MNEQPLPKLETSVGYRERPLNPDEVKLARTIFEDTIPYERVFINNLLTSRRVFIDKLLTSRPGLSCVPFTTPSNINPLTICIAAAGAVAGGATGGMLAADTIGEAFLGAVIGAVAGAVATATVLGMTALNPKRRMSYKINWHDAIVEDSATKNDDWKATLIHELTHVWQGHNSRWAWGYVCNSLWHQGAATLKRGTRNGAYAYSIRADSDGIPADKFASYNVEQQAQIVEDAFVAGPSQAPLNWWYVTHHMQAAKTQ